MKIYVNNNFVEVSAEDEDYLLIISELQNFHKKILVTSKEEVLEKKEVDYNAYCIGEEKFKKVVERVRELAKIDNEIDQEAEVHNFLADLFLDNLSSEGGE